MKTKRFNNEKKSNRLTLFVFIFVSVFMLIFANIICSNKVSAYAGYYYKGPDGKEKYDGAAENVYITMPDKGEETFSTFGIRSDRKRSWGSGDDDYRNPVWFDFILYKDKNYNNVQSRSDGKCRHDMYYSKESGHTYGELHITMTIRRRNVSSISCEEHNGKRHVYVNVPAGFHSARITLGYDIRLSPGDIHQRIYVTDSANTAGSYSSPEFNYRNKDGSYINNDTYLSGTLYSDHKMTGDIVIDSWYDYTPYYTFSYGSNPYVSLNSSKVTHDINSTTGRAVITYKFELTLSLGVYKPEELKFTWHYSKDSTNSVEINASGTTFYVDDSAPTGRYHMYDTAISEGSSSVIKYINNLDETVDLIGSDDCEIHFFYATIYKNGSYYNSKKIYINSSSVYKSVKMSEFFTDEGKYEFTIHATDYANRMSEDTTFIVVYDKTPPSIIKANPITNGLEPGFTPDGKIKFNLNFRDNLSGVYSMRVSTPESSDFDYLNCETLYTNNNYYSDFNSNSFNYGNNNINITVYDRSGNYTNTTTSIVFDNVFPTISKELIINSLHNNKYLYEYDKYYIYGTVKDEYLYDYYIQEAYFDGHSSNTSCRPTTTSGTNPIQVKYTCTSDAPINFDSPSKVSLVARDKAGNVSESIKYDLYHIDTSRDVKLEDFYVMAKNANDKNYISNQKVANGTVTIYYKGKNLEYMDYKYMYLSIGEKSTNTENSQYIFVNSMDNSCFINSGGTITISGKCGGMDGNNPTKWHSNFINGDVRKAYLIVRTKYGHFSNINIDVTFDYEAPAINDFRVHRADNGHNAFYWTNSLNNKFTYDVVDNVSYVYENRFVQKIGSKFNNLNTVNLNNRTITLNKIENGKRFNVQLHTEDAAGNISVVIYENLSYDITNPYMPSSTANEKNFEVTNGHVYSFNELLAYINRNHIEFKLKANDNDSGIYSIKIYTNRISDGHEISDNNHSLWDKFSLDKQLTLNSNFDLPMSHGGDKDGRRKIYVVIEDGASNKINIKLNYEIEYDTIAPKIAYDFNKKDLNVTINIYDLNMPKDKNHISKDQAKYYLSATRNDLTLTEVLNSSLLDFVKLNNNKDIVADLPLSVENENIYLYLILNNIYYMDLAGNYPAQSKIENYFQCTSYYIKNAEKSHLTTGDFSLNNGKFFENKGILVVYSNESNVLDAYSIKNLNSYLDSNVLRGEILGKENQDYKIINGTYAYDNIIFRSYDNSKFEVIDVIILNTNPILETTSNINVNDVILTKGEEFSNYGVSFISPMGLKINTTETVTLNGVKVDKVDTNIPGTYSIKTVATDELGQESYIIKTIVVEDSITDKEEKNITVMPLIKEVNKQELVKENKDNEILKHESISLPSLYCLKLLNVDEDVIVINDEKILLNEEVVTFKLFSKYFFKIYDG